MKEYKTKAEVTAEDLANFLWRQMEGRLAPQNVIELVSANFEQFNYDIEEDFVTKKMTFENMNRETLRTNAKLLRNLLRGV